MVLRLPYASRISANAVAKSVVRPLYANDEMGGDGVPSHAWFEDELDESLLLTVPLPDGVSTDCDDVRHKIV